MVEQLARGRQQDKPRTLPILLVCGLVWVGLVGCEKRESVEQLVAEAQRLLDAGELPAAVIKLEDALTADPKNLAARLMSAQVYVDMGQPDAALGVLERAEQDGAGQLNVAKPRAEAQLIMGRYQEVLNTTAVIPENAPGPLRASLLAERGAALAALGQKTMARALLEQALAVDPHSVDVRIAGARLAIVDGNSDAARNWLNEASRDAPDDRRLRQLKGDVAYAGQKFRDAEDVYQKIIEAEPWNQLARIDLAATQLANDELTAAAASLDAVLNDPDLADIPKDPMMSHMRAVIAYRLKDYSLAQSDAEAVVSRAPDYEPARLIAAASSYALQEYERANYYIAPYVNQEPQDVWGRKLLAAIQLHLSHPIEAEDTLAPVKDTATNDTELVTLIGVTAARSGDLATAHHYLTLAAQQQPHNLAVWTELGRTEFARGDSKAGIEDLEEAAVLEPSKTGPLVPLFLAYLQTKQYDKAISIAERVTADDPNAAMGYLFIASVDLMKGDLEAGRASLLKAREVDPGDPTVNRNLAKLALAEGHLDEARQYYRDIVKSNPKSTSTYLALAAIDLKAGSSPAAETTLIEGLQANPDDIGLTVVVADLQLAAGKAQEALTRGQQALKKAPRDPALLDVIGRAQKALGMDDDALSTFHDLTDVVPRSASAHADLAEAYLAKYSPGNPQWPAINEATEAVELDPHDRAAKIILARALILHNRFVEARRVLADLKSDGKSGVTEAELDGLLARGEGRLSDAAAAFTQAVTLTDNAADRQRLADLQRQLGHPDRAAMTLKGWVEAHPEDVHVREVLADIDVEMGRLDEAAEEYLTLVKVRPSDPARENNLAWILLRMGRLNEALEHAREAVALAPDSADELDTLGLVLLKSGSPRDAIRPLESAWVKSSHRADVGFHLAQALAAAGKTAEARDMLHGVLASDSAFTEQAEARQLLQQIDR